MPMPSPQLHAAAAITAAHTARAADAYVGVGASGACNCARFPECMTRAFYAGAGFPQFTTLRQARQTRIERF
jgi:hypothetical protein